MLMSNPLPILSKFLRFFGANFVTDNVPQNAAALAYTTLISLVPLTVVMFAVASAFPAFSHVGTDVQGWVFENFVPAAGEVVQEHLSQFAEKASKLTATGILFLVLAAILLIATIDRTFNAIWNTRRVRNPVNGFMMYWALLTLAPVLIGLSVGLTSYVISMPLLNDAASSLGVRKHVLSMAPFLVSTLAFTMMYVIVPNARVKIRHALVGGFVAAGLFELAKRGFGFFITQFPTYELIYGALAAIPIFLVWIYLCWLIALFGAELTYCLGAFSAVDEVDGESTESDAAADSSVIRLSGREPPESAEV